jgi:methionyl-tRNA synthetase
VNAKYESNVPSLETAAAPTDSDEKLIREVNDRLKLYIEALDDVKIREGLRLAMEISALGNVYLQENKIDNTLFAEHRDRCDRVVTTALNLIYLLSAVLFPYIPSTSESIARQLNAPVRLLPEQFSVDSILPGHVINKAEYLFKRIDEKMEDVWRSKYGGNSSEPAPEDKKKKKKVAAKAAAAPVFVGEKPEEVKDLEKQIEEQGIKVRDLKAAKADTAVVQTEVSTLLGLKKDLADLFAKLSV